MYLLQQRPEALAKPLTVLWLTELLSHAIAENVAMHVISEHLHNVDKIRDKFILHPRSR